MISDYAKGPCAVGGYLQPVAEQQGKVGRLGGPRVESEKTALHELARCRDSTMG